MSGAAYGLGVSVAAGQKPRATIPSNFCPRIPSDVSNVITCQVNDCVTSRMRSLRPVLRHFGEGTDPMMLYGVRNYGQPLHGTEFASLSG